MKKYYLVLFVVLVIGIFSGTLFSTVESRIEGVIVDDQTGLPLKGAYIELISCENEESLSNDGNTMSIELHYRTKSKKNGGFRFDYVQSGDYFLQIFLEGYSVLGPLLYYDKGFMNDNFWDIYVNKFGFQLNSSRVKTFHIKEGRIKHFNIRLKKEAILKVNIFAKTASYGTIPYKNGFSINVKHEFIGNVKSWKNNRPDGSFISKFLKAGNVKVKIYLSNYNRQNYEIKLENGKTKVINCVLDFTKGQIIHGFIRKKNGEPHIGANIHINPLNDESLSGLSTDTDENGEYWLGNLKVGIYKIIIYDFNIGFHYEKTIQIKPDEKIELNKEL